MVVVVELEGFCAFSGCFLCILVMGVGLSALCLCHLACRFSFRTLGFGCFGIFASRHQDGDVPDKSLDTWTGCRITARWAPDHTCDRCLLVWRFSSSSALEGTRRSKQAVLRLVYIPFVKKEIPVVSKESTFQRTTWMLTTNTFGNFGLSKKQHRRTKLVKRQPR